ncbi:EamA family transporter, partial [Spirulina subsalsa CS-330]|uniref:EamA family transporter n=1 Tax=Spirulina subsalsa TaxID=54311 RepID=UPI00232E4795
ITIAAFGGTYLAIWLQQIALKYTATGTAQTLLATSPLFVLPLAALWGETITPRSVLGVGIAIAGIALLFQA